MAVDKKISELAIIQKIDNIIFPGIYSGNNYGIRSSDMGRSDIQSMTTTGTISKSIVEINASVKRVITTLPDRAEWEGKSIYIKNKAIGVALIQRSGSDVIGEDSKISIPLYWSGDYLELFAGKTRWEIKSGRSKITGGMKNTSDWTNAHLASIIEVDIDGGAAPSLLFDIGEIVEESTSGYEARIYDMLDNGDGTGTLWLYDIDGNLTNNRTLTGQNSTAVATINEPTGTTKNLDTVFKHNYDEDITNTNIKYIFFLSTDTVTSWEIRPYCGDSFVGHGLAYIGVDTDNHKTQTGTIGFNIMQDSGSSTSIQTNDIYFIDWTIWNYGG